MARRSSARRQGSVRLHLEGLEVRDTPAAVGTLDPSFGTAGKVGLTGVGFSGAVLQPDGKVVAVGTAGGDFVVARFNIDGSADTTFNVTGSRTVDMGGATDAANAVAIQADGKIVVAGTDGANFAVLRLNADGSTDTAFDADGRVNIDFGGTDVAKAVVVQGDGRIVVAGTNGTDFALARINPADGSLDTTFTTTGKQMVDLGGVADMANAVAIQSDGKLVVAGTNGLDFAVIRLNPGGSLDTNFDGDGKLTLDLGGGADTARGITLQPDGKIVIVGSNGADFAIVRLLPADGSLDNTFDIDGKRFVDISGVDNARAVLVQPDGKLVVVGDTGVPDIAAVRLNGDGGLDTSFNGTGRALFDLGAADAATAVARTAAGRLVVAGSAGAGDGVLLRLAGLVEVSRNLAVGGSTDAKATIYAPNAPASQYTPTAIATPTPFGNLTVDVRTAVADVNGDGVEDTILVTGPGTAIRLAVVSGKDGSVLVAPFDPFGGNFTGGGFVAAADYDNDGKAEFIVTPDRGGGPRVTIFSLQGATAVARANFFGINDAGFRGGARAAAGDINGDGIADLVVSAGYGGGPRIAVYNGKTLFTTQATFLNDFFAFEQELRNGAYVAVGDVDGDGFGDLIFGAGPGGGPRVQILSGKLLLTSGSTTALASPLANFFAGGGDNGRGGVRVAAKDVDGDNKADVATGSGEGQPSQVRVYPGKNLIPIGEPAGVQVFDPFTRTLTDGVFVG